MATEGGPNIIEDGLVLYLDAANQKSYPVTGTTWLDLSQYKGEGILYNNPSHTGISLNFDGTSDYIRFTRSDLNGGSFAYTNLTFNMWVRPSVNGSGGGTNNNLFTIENTFEISIGNNTNGYSQVFYASVPWAWYGTTANVLKNGEWNMLTYVHASVGRWIYVNGVEVFYRGDTGNLSAGSAGYPYVSIMGRYTGTSSPAEGDVGMVKLYNRVLTPQELLQNYNATKSRFGL